MHCGSCAMLIQEELEETNGIESANVSFEGKEAIVEFDENMVDKAAISKQITELGYEIVN